MPPFPGESARKQAKYREKIPIISTVPRRPGRRIERRKIKFSATGAKLEIKALTSPGSAAIIQARARAHLARERVRAA